MKDCVPWINSATPRPRLDSLRYTRDSTPLLLRRRTRRTARGAETTPAGTSSGTRREGRKRRKRIGITAMIETSSAAKKRNDDGWNEWSINSRKLEGIGIAAWRMHSRMHFTVITEILTVHNNSMTVPHRAMLVIRPHRSIPTTRQTATQRTRRTKERMMPQPQPMPHKILQQREKSNGTITGCRQNRHRPNTKCLFHSTPLFLPTMHQRILPRGQRRLIWVTILHPEAAAGAPLTVWAAMILREESRALGANTYCRNRCARFWRDATWSRGSTCTWMAGIILAQVLPATKTTTLVRINTPRSYPA